MASTTGGSAATASDRARESTRSWHGAGAGQLRSDSPRTDSALADLVLEFVEVLCHGILLNDCPFILTTGGRDARLDWLEAAVFERRKMYDIAVSMSRHPELNDYIHQVLVNARSWLLKGSLQGIAIVLLDAQERVVERFVVQVASLVSRDEAGGEGLDHVIVQLDDGFRRTLTKLGFVSLPPSRPGELTFRMMALVEQGGAEAAASAPDEPWVEADAGNVLLGGGQPSQQAALGAIRAHGVSLNVAAECATGS